MARKSRKKFSCDFETTTKLDDCRVWGYAYMEIGNPTNWGYGNNLDEFMEWVEEINADLYFHNLKFDGSFIVNWLLKNGFTYSKEGEKNTFNIIISNMGQWYMIDVSYGYKNNRKIHTVFYDSLKKLPFSVSRIAKSFRLDVLKGEIDYHLERGLDYEIKDDELDYMKNDVEIVAKALDIQFSQGLTKMTNGSDSLSGYKTSIGKEVFEQLFPVLEVDLDSEIRMAYRGGFTWLNEKYKGLDLKDGIVFDVNSLYPSVMYNKDLPYGHPIPYVGKYDEDKEYPLFIQHIRCSFELKEGHIPTIQIKKDIRFKATEYLHHSNEEIVDLYVTNVDLELIKEHYHLYDLEYGNGWKFKSATGMFNKFIDRWSYIKMTETGAIRELAKLMLNSLYGKFASNPDVTGMLPYLKEDGSNGFVLGEEELKEPVYTPMGVFITSYARELTIRTSQKCYNRIIYCDTDSMHLVGTEIPENIKDIIDPKKMGCWDFEGQFMYGRYLRQKTYMQKIISIKGIFEDLKDVPIKGKKGEGYYHKNELYLWVDDKFEKVGNIGDDNRDTFDIPWVVKCAGMPENVKEKVTWENFHGGFSSYGKLLPKQVSGGVVLVDTEYTIK